MDAAISPCAKVAKQASSALAMRHALVEFAIHRLQFASVQRVLLARLPVGQSLRDNAFAFAMAS